MSPEPSDLSHDPDWPTAVHEAGHAVVGMAVGGVLGSLTGVPPRACIEFKPSTSRRAQLATAVAGPAAERMAKGAEAEATLDTSLKRFFDQLGEDGIESFRADQLAMAAEEDDLDVVVPLIDSYASRRLGLAQFRQARSRAIRILEERWDDSKSWPARSLNNSVPVCRGMRLVGTRTRAVAFATIPESI
jgi:hypothetical protein